MGGVTIASIIAKIYQKIKNPKGVKVKKLLKTFVASFAVCALLAPSAFVLAKSGAEQEKQSYAKEYKQYSIADALQSSEAQARLSPNIEFYFGLGNLGGKELIAGFAEVNHKNALKHFDSIKEACDNAFVIALAKIQQKVQEVGANSALNVVSLNNNSKETYECLVRALDVKVTLKTSFGK